MLLFQSIPSRPHAQGERAVYSCIYILDPNIEIQVGWGNGYGELRGKQVPINIRNGRIKYVDNKHVK